MSRRTVFLTALVGALLLAAGLARTGWRNRYRTKVDPSPRLACPREINIGPHETGEIVVTPIRLQNVGDSELVIDSFRSDCACSGLSRRRVNDSGFDPVGRVRLAPSEVTELSVRVAIGRGSNQPIKHTITFRCNDPSRPTGEIAVVIPRIFGGLRTVPADWPLGEAVIDRPRREIFVVVDDAREPRNLHRVAVSDSKRLSARLMPPRTEDSEVTATGQVVGAVEVSVIGDAGGVFDEHVIMFGKGSDRELGRLRVFGAIRPKLEFIPEELYLPRVSNAGPVFDATAICRNRSSESFQISVVDCPTWLYVELPERKSDRDHQLVNVRLLGKPDVARAESVRFRVQGQKPETVLSLRVNVRIGDSP